MDAEVLQSAIQDVSFDLSIVTLFFLVGNIKDTFETLYPPWLSAIANEMLGLFDIFFKVEQTMLVHEDHGLYIFWDARWHAI